MLQPTYIIVDGNKNRVGELRYNKLAAAKANAKRTAVKRAKSGKSHVESYISVMQIADTLTNIWAKDMKVESFYGYDLIERAA